MCHKIQLDVEVVLGRVWKSSRGRLQASATPRRWHGIGRSKWKWKFCRQGRGKGHSRERTACAKAWKREGRH